MSGKRLISLLVALVVGAAILSACSGSDGPEDEPNAKPTATRDAGGFTPEEREVVDAVEAYNKAFFGRGASPVEPAIEKLVTKRLLGQVGPAESKAVDKAGLQYIGTVRIHPDTVTVDGNDATYRGCQDGSGAFVVKKGQTKAGPGSTPVSSVQLEIGLVREGGRWLVDAPRGERVDSCTP